MQWWHGRVLDCDCDEGICLLYPRLSCYYLPFQPRLLLVYTNKTQPTQNEPTKSVLEIVTVTTESVWYLLACHGIRLCLRPFFCFLYINQTKLRQTNDTGFRRRGCGEGICIHPCLSCYHVASHSPPPFPFFYMNHTQTNKTRQMGLESSTASATREPI